MNTMRLTKNMALLLASTMLAFTISSCKKDKDEDEHNPPSLTFKTTTGYTSANVSVTQGSDVKFGLVATKTEDDLNTFNVSRVYDAGASTTVSNEALSGGERNGFTRDVTITTRSITGTEKYSFTVTDADGNISSLSVTITTIP